MPPRRLTEAELAIWREVTKTVVPRPGSLLPAMPSAAAPAQPVVVSAAQKPPARTYAVPSYTPPVSVQKPPPIGLERRYKRRVAGGRVPVDAVLDLHGMTQPQAHVALHRFLVNAQRDGSRLVIVVTGKGLKDRVRQDAAEPGVLRRAVPFWLRDAPLRHMVIGFEEAALTHGGAGALYIRLRRSSD